MGWHAQHCSTDPQREAIKCMQTHTHTFTDTHIFKVDAGPSPQITSSINFTVGGGQSFSLSCCLWPREERECGEWALAHGSNCLPCRAPSPPRPGLDLLPYMDGNQEPRSTIQHRSEIWQSTGIITREKAPAEETINQTTYLPPRLGFSTGENGLILAVARRCL